MKVCRIDLRYWMPDDWSGSPADALRECARFLEDGEPGLNEPPADAAYGPSHHAFWNGTQQGFRMNAEVTVYEAEPPRWKWSPVACPISGLPRVHSDGGRIIK